VSVFLAEEKLPKKANLLTKSAGSNRKHQTSFKGQTTCCVTGL
jgi:hypothetical protein